MISKISAIESPVTISFETTVKTLSLEQIVPTRVLSKSLSGSPKYQQILSSIREVGVIEPLVVSNKKKDEGYYLLDGHIRLHALKALEAKTVECLLSKDDESFTYNKHVNRLAPVQEHHMIVKAVKRGVSEEKIACALNLDVKSIINKRNLLKGICAEAADLLKDKIVPGGVFTLLKRMIPMRQIEAATLMNDANNYSISYAKAILGGTCKEQLKNPEKPKRIKGLDPEQMARMESEMANLQREYRLIEEGYGIDVLNLTLAKGYLGSLLSNVHILSYLAQRHPEMLLEFQKITEITSLNGEQGGGA